MDAVIAVENLGKKYVLRHQRCPGCGTLRDAMTHVARAAWQRVRHPFSPNRESLDLEEMWALKDVNFEVQQGERLGIIGRNGAGKSTLLKILSRITHPTTGRVHLRGRVSSLLEVGTGFHPELTGRENIFLNGAILGMTRQEIKGKFDEIVAFAEVEKFLDTPVKHYSSGMYVRLAFAVAAHLEPEILIVDEVLAVGDAQFQKKCLGKMGEVASGGRTVLFVSHHMPSVQRLCSKAVLLKNGTLQMVGSAQEVVTRYCDEAGRELSLQWERFGQTTAPCYFRKIWLGDERGHPLKSVQTSSACRLYLDFTIDKSCKELQLSVGLLNDSDDQIFGTSPRDAGEPVPQNEGDYRACLVLPPHLLLIRPYVIRAALWHPQLGGLDRVDALRFTPEETSSPDTYITATRAGFIAIKCDWSISHDREAIAAGEKGSV